MPSTLGIVASSQNFPLSLSPALWFDAADTATITESGGSVSQWDDKSGNSRHLTQATAARQPTTGVTTLNGLNVIDFNQSLIHRMSNSTFTESQPTSVWIVGKAVGTGGVAFFDSLTTNGAHYVGRSSGGVRSLVFAGTPLFGNALGANPVVFGCVFDGASSEFYLDNSLEAQGQAGAGGLDGVRIGDARGSGGRALDGFICEIVFFDRVIGTLERNALYEYFSSKWDL